MSQKSLDDVTKISTMPIRQIDCCTTIVASLVRKSFWLVIMFKDFHQHCYVPVSEVYYWN